MAWFENCRTAAETAKFAKNPAEGWIGRLRQLLAGMDEEERRLVELKLEQHTNLQMAEKLNCSERVDGTLGFPYT